MQVGIGRRVETERPFQKLYIDFLGSADSRIARLRIGGGSVSGVADKA